MKSTVKKQIKSKSRTSQQGRKRRPKSTRGSARAAEPVKGMASYISTEIAVDVGALPGWRDLTDKNQKSRFASPAKKRVNSFFDGVSTARFALFILAAALALSFYVRHVFATQETLSRLEQLRRENLQLQLQYNQLKGVVGQELSPNQIYRRATALGLQPGTDFAGEIRVVPMED